MVIKSVENNPRPPAGQIMIGMAHQVAPILPRDTTEQVSISSPPSSKSGKPIKVKPK